MEKLGSRPLRSASGSEIQTAIEVAVIDIETISQIIDDMSGYGAAIAAAMPTTGEVESRPSAFWHPYNEVDDR